MNEFSDSTPTDVVRCPMVPIRDVVVFPYTMVAFVIGRPASVRALEAALRGNKTIFLAPNTMLPSTNQTLIKSILLGQSRESRITCVYRMGKTKEREGGTRISLFFAPA